MATYQSKVVNESPSRKATALSVSQVILRFVAFGASLASSLIMLKNKQTLSLFGFQLDAKYTYSSAFRFLVIANFVACAYSLVSLPFAIVLTSKYTSRRRFFMFLLDLLIMGLLIAASSAATAIGFVGKYGNVHTGWAAICDPLAKFCDRATYSIALSYIALVIFLIITISSAATARSSPVNPSY